MCFQSKLNNRTIAQTLLQQWRFRKPHQQEPYIYELAIMVAHLPPNIQKEVLHNINQLTSNTDQSTNPHA